MAEIFTDRFQRVVADGFGDNYQVNLDIDPPGSASVNGQWGTLEPQASLECTIPAGTTSAGTVQFDFWVPADVADGWTYYRYGWPKCPAPALGTGWYFFNYLYVFSWGDGTWGAQASASANFNFTPEASTWYTAKSEIFGPNGTIRSIRIKVWKRGDVEPTDTGDPNYDSGTSNTGNSPTFNTDWMSVGGGEVEPSRFDNIRVWDEVILFTEEPTVAPPKPDPLVTVQIRYDGDDITDYCSISDSSFTSRAGGIPGQCQVTFKDTRQQFNFTPGKTLELYLDGVRQWDGYAVSVGYNYWFETHTADCEPCPHVTPRKRILYGVDRNILFAKRVLYNKADPDDPVEGVWPANTTDQEVIISSIDDYLDDIDGVDYTTKVEVVGSPDPYVEFRVPGPTNTLGLMMKEISESTGAVFYIDPDRYLVYTDVDTPNAPYALSDKPSEEGDVGYRELDLTEDASRVINDAMVWGAGQGSSDIVFARVEDTNPNWFEYDERGSIEIHGRWQNTDGFRYNMWQQSSVQRAAESIVYGSPSNKRGHKDPVWSARVVTHTPGFRVADKVDFESVIHEYSDVIPIREMTTSFISNNSAKFELLLSHDIDEPWTTSEFWWPDPTQITEPPPPPPPTRACTTAVPTDTLVVTNTFDPDAEGVPSRIARLNNIDSDFSIQHGHNHWTFFQTLDGTAYSNKTGNVHEVEVDFGEFYTDDYFYNNGGGGLENPGYRVPVYVNERLGILAPINTNSPGAGVYMHISGEVTFTGTEAERDVEGFLFPIPGVSRVGTENLSLPHHVMISLTIPRAGEEQSPEPHVVGAVIWEAMMTAGQTLPVEINLHMEESVRRYIGIDIEELELTKPWASAQALFVFPTGIEWTMARSNALPVPPDEDGQVCIEVGYGMPNTHLAAVHLYGNVWKVAFPYVPGSTRVYVDGIHIPGDAYQETSPTLGQITFDPDYAPDPDDNVSVAFTPANIAVALPEAPGYFILPVSGPISGSFGSQMSSWPPAYWHGIYYEHFHNGVDFAVGVGTPVYAAQEGFVVLEDQEAGGQMVHIYHDNGMRTVYAHMSNRAVNTGDSVAQGDFIGHSGATGQVTGPHLHWGLVYQGSPENPLDFI